MSVQLYHAIRRLAEPEAPLLAKRWGISERQAKKKIAALALFVAAWHRFRGTMPQRIPRSVKATLKALSPDLQAFVADEEPPQKKAKEKHLPRIQEFLERAAKQMNVQGVGT